MRAALTSHVIAAQRRALETTRPTLTGPTRPLERSAFVLRSQHPSSLPPAVAERRMSASAGNLGQAVQKHDQVCSQQRKARRPHSS